MRQAGLVGRHHPSCDWYEEPTDAERIFQHQRALGERQNLLEAEVARLTAENTRLKAVDMEKEAHTAILDLVLRLRGHKMSEATIRFIIGHCLDLSFAYLGETPEASEPAPRDKTAREVVDILIKNQTGGPVEVTAGLIGTIAK